MGQVDQETRRLAKVVDHPLRSRIIDILGERGPLGWKELSLELGVKTGALYHHLDVLEDLVERDADKKYNLTKSGRIVYTRISEGRSVQALKLAAIDLSREGRGRRRATSLFAPRPLIAALTSSPARSSVTLTTALAILATAAYFGGISPQLYFLHPDPGLLFTLGGLAASLAAILTVSFVAARYAFKASVQMGTLAAGCAISYLPVFAFSLFSLLPPASSLFAASSVTFTFILVVFQTWSATFLGAAVSVASGVRIERTILVGMAVLYVTMFLMLIHGTTL